MAIYLGETSFPQGNGSHFRLRMYIDNYSQSIENNTTWVRFHLYFVSLDGYSGSGSASNGYINGNHTGSTTSISKNATVDMGYWDTTIYHNNDGTGGINWNGRITSPWGIGTAELSGYWTAPTIPRTTKLATQNGIIGNLINITWSKASANFRHTLTYEFGNKTGTIGTNLVDGVDWNIPDSFYEEMEDSSSKQGNLTLTTYNGSTNIGSSTAILNVSVNESVVSPVITSKSVKDINTKTLELTGDNGTLISANSIPFAQIEFTTNKYATLSKITINGVDYTSDVVILSESDTNTNYMLEKELPVADKSDFEINVIDSRSLPINDIIKLDFINYIALDCIPVFKRIQPTTGEVGLEFDGKYFNDDFGAVNNNLKISYAYKIKEEDTYSNEILLNENTDYKIVNNTFHSGSGTYKSQINLGAIFDYKKVYNFILYVEDKLTKLVINVLVVKGIPIFWWNGEKVTINGDLYIADTDGNNPVNIKDNLDVVVDNLDDNATDKAPSQRAVNEALLDVYSTEEKVVGTYVDGKPVYEKTFTGGYANGATLVSNVDKMISVDGQALISDIYRLIPYFELYGGKSYAGTVRNYQNKITTEFKIADANTSAYIDITIRYTKTTD